MASKSTRKKVAFNFEQRKMEEIQKTQILKKNH